jgi:hypothetical protein
MYAIQSHPSQSHPTNPCAPFALYYYPTPSKIIRSYLSYVKCTGWDGMGRDHITCGLLTYKLGMGQVGINPKSRRGMDPKAPVTLG